MNNITVKMDNKINSKSFFLLATYQHKSAKPPLLVTIFWLLLTFNGTNIFSTDAYNFFDFLALVMVMEMDHTLSLSKNCLLFLSLNLLFDFLALSSKLVATPFACSPRLLYILLYLLHSSSTQNL